VNRDYSSVMNMDWKLTPEAWIKGVWWNMRREIDRRKYEGKSNPLIPQNIVQVYTCSTKDLHGQRGKPRSAGKSVKAIQTHLSRTKS